MPRLNAFWIAVPALVCVAAAPAAYAISIDSQALIRGLEARNKDKGERIERRLTEIEARDISDADKAKAKADFLKAEIEKAEDDQRAAAQFGSPEGQRTARDVTAFLKALREQERWEAARGGPNSDAPNRRNQILVDGAGQAVLQEYSEAVTELEDRQRAMAQQAAEDERQYMQKKIDDATREAADILRAAEQERRRKAEEEAQRQRQTSMATPAGGGEWDVALRYAGEFAGFRIASGSGYLGQERVGTSNRDLGLVQPSDTSDSAFRTSLLAGFDVTGLIESIRLGEADTRAQTWIKFGGQFADVERRSNFDRLDVGTMHRILIPGTGDPFSPDGEGFSVGPGSGFNLVRDISFRENTDMWTAWMKGGQTCHNGNWTVSGYGLFGYTQIDTHQTFSGRLPNVPPSLDFRYDTRVDTGVATFGLGLDATYPLNFAPGFSVHAGAFAGADFVRSSGSDHLRVERPGFFVSTQSVRLHEADVSLGYELNAGVAYDFGGGLSADLTARYGSHDTGIDISRTGADPSSLKHVSADAWSVGIGVTWSR